MTPEELSEIRKKIAKEKINLILYEKERERAHEKQAIEEAERKKKQAETKAKMKAKIKKYENIGKKVIRYLEKISSEPRSYHRRSYRRSRRRIR